MELTVDTLNLINGLQKYDLIDEVHIHKTTDICGSGIRLSDVLEIKQ